MNNLTYQFYRYRWLNFPALLLVTLLQRTPVLRTLVTTEFVLSSTASTVLKGVFSGVAALGAVQTVAGATEIDPAPESAENPASAEVGVEFQAAVAITGAPAVAASYEITGDIPPGITISGLSGDTVNAQALAFTGTPTAAGEYVMSIRAWRGQNKTELGGTPTFTYTINVTAAADEPPTITTQPAPQTVSVGASVSFSVEAAGDPAPTFQWQKDGADIGGATSATFTIASATLADVGAYAVVVTNAGGSVTSTGAMLTVEQVAAEFEITGQPNNSQAASGASLQLTVGATGDNLEYQWFKYPNGQGDPVAVSGATGATLMFPGLAFSNAGVYFARVTSGATTSDSDPAIVTVTGGESRLSNLSTRGVIAPGGILTPGFALAGTGSKSLVIRAVGPQLGVFGVPGAMADTTLDIIPFGSGDPLISNDNWNDSANVADLRTTSGALGAFGLEESSLDAAVLADLPLPNSQGNRSYTVSIRSSDAAVGGAALAEVYDTDGLDGTVKLINLSVRGQSGVGAEALTPGFVIAGNGVKEVLVRVIGPELATFGVSGTMVDPKLEVIPLGQSVVIAENDDWGGTSELTAAFASSGAFTLSDTTSKDAALVLALPPGGYTVRVSGADGGTGEVLVEVYDLD